MSGMTLRDIVDRASKSGQTVADGLIHFLDEKLLGSDEPVTVSEVTYLFFLPYFLRLFAVPLLFCGILETGMLTMLNY